MRARKENKTCNSNQIELGYIDVINTARTYILYSNSEPVQPIDSFIDKLKNNNFQSITTDALRAIDEIARNFTIDNGTYYLKDSLAQKIIE